MPARCEDGEDTHSPALENIMKDRHVVITGANRGIGAALAAGYRAQGNRVTATSRDGKAGVALEVTIRRHTPKWPGRWTGRPWIC